MFQFKFLRACVFATLVMATTPIFASTLLGETVTIQSRFPVINSLGTSLGNIVVGPGLEATYGTVLEFDIGANTLTLTAQNDAYFVHTSFNGFSITDTFGSFSDFLSFSLVSSDFTNVQTSFDADNLFINFGSADYFETGYTAIYSFTLADSSVVPIPPALPLLGTGIALMGFMGWRRKRKAA